MQPQLCPLLGLRYLCRACISTIPFYFTESKHKHFRKWKSSAQQALTAYSSSAYENRHLGKHSLAWLKFSSSKQYCFITISVLGAGGAALSRCLPRCRAHRRHVGLGAVPLPLTHTALLEVAPHTQCNWLVAEKKKLTKGNESGSAFPICKVS